MTPRLFRGRRQALAPRGAQGDIPFTGGARIPTRDWLGTRQPEIYGNQSADKKPEQAAWAESQYPG